MSEVEEAILADVMGDEAVVLELQSYLSSPPTQVNPENVADSTPQGQGGKRQRQQPHLPVGLPVGPSCGQLTGSLDHGQGSMTPRQKALHVARQSMQIARTNVEICKVVRTLSLALGSTRMESGTVKAVHAVLLQLDRPGMKDIEVCTSTGASMSNYKKWRRRVEHAQLDLARPA